jgi:uncharacterized protein (TIGR03083 family)
VTARLDAVDWLPRLEATTSGFAALLVGADLDRPVLACPGWRLADLAHHLGNVHAWAEHAVIACDPNLPEAPAPSDPGELAGWYSDRAGSLLATLTATDPDAPAWAFGPGVGRAGFWRRRQTHETTVHLWDAVRSQGDDMSVDAVLACDGLDEVASVLFPRQVRLGRTGRVTRPVAIQPTDVDVPPFVLGGDGASPINGRDAVAVVSAPADALMLLLWKRIPPDDDRLVVTGDRAAYLGLLARALTP